MVKRWRLLHELAWLKAMAWMVGFRRPARPSRSAGPLAMSNPYQGFRAVIRAELPVALAEIYHQLADWHEERGRARRAARLRDRAFQHNPESRPPDLPPAISMARPVPRSYRVVDARGRPLRSRSGGRSGMRGSDRGSA